MKNSQGQRIMKKQDILNIWKSHFEKHLNTQFPHDEDALREPDKLNSENYRAIVLLSIPGKVFCRILDTHILLKNQ